MSKGLEAFKRIKSYFNPKQLLTKEKTLNDLDTIEKELKDYQEIEELSRALSITTCENGDLLKCKKALEIIDKKAVNVNRVKQIIAKGCPWYIYNFIQDIHRHLTEEEFDLLKEALL